MRVKQIVMNNEALHNGTREITEDYTLIKSSDLHDLFTQQYHKFLNQDWMTNTNNTEQNTTPQACSMNNANKLNGLMNRRMTIPDP